MPKVTESERIWKSIDENTKAVKNLCERVTSVETTITNHQAHKDRITYVLIGVIGAVLTAVNILV